MSMIIFAKNIEFLANYASFSNNCFVEMGFCTRFYERIMTELIFEYERVSYEY